MKFVVHMVFSCSLSLLGVVSSQCMVAFVVDPQILWQFNTEYQNVSR